MRCVFMWVFVSVLYGCLCVCVCWIGCLFVCVGYCRWMTWWACFKTLCNGMAILQINLPTSSGSPLTLYAYTSRWFKDIARVLA